MLIMELFKLVLFIQFFTLYKNQKIRNNTNSMNSYFWQGTKKNESSIKKPSFQLQFSQQQRVKKQTSLQQRYPRQNFSYLVIEGLDKFPNQKNAYLQIVLENSTPVTYLIQYLRRTLELGKAVSLFLQIGGKVRQISKQLGQINKQAVSADGFLYIKLKTQNSFG